MKFYGPFLTIIFLIIGAPPAHAEGKLFGLAMHGNAKYNQNSAHLDYVNPDAPKGGALKMAAIGSFDTLNPYSIKGQAPENMNLVYDRLMRRVWDEPFTMYPLIAEHVEISEDRSSITFYINPLARFHDGSPITSDDVLFSFETLREHGRPNMRNIYKLVSKAEILEPQSIKFSLGDGYDRETVMILAMMPVLSKVWWQNRNFDETVTENPVLNGPYKIKELETGRYITYERVDDYWAKDLFVNKGHYNFETITYDYYRDDTIALESFKKGDLNMRREWDVTKWETAYEDIKDYQTKLATPHQRPERAHGFIFNIRKSPFNDRNVRKALSLAFDYEWIGSNLFHNEFKRMESYYPNSVLDGSGELSEATQKLMNDWVEDIHPEAFSPVFKDGIAGNLRARLKEADKLLTESGWTIKNGKRLNSSGEPLSFELLLSTPQEEKIALTFKRTLERLGVDIRIRMMDSATFQKRKITYDYEMLSFFWQNSLSPGTEQMLYWSCKAAEEPARFNYAGICNPALDHFASIIANAQTYGALTDYAHIIDRILLSEYISIPLFYKGMDYVAINENIKFPDITPLYGIVTETWWLDKNDKPKQAVQ